MDDGSYACRLICSKSRLAPARQISIPRTELCGAVLGCRLRNFVQRELTWKIENVSHFIDSEIVKAQIHRDSFRFNVFVANRISEIQTITSLDEWYWIPSEVCNYRMLDSNYVWQNGPEFLRCPSENWPIKSECNVEVPYMAYWRKGLVKCTSVEPELIDIDKFNDYDKLLNVTSRVLNVFKGKSLLKLLKTPDYCNIEEVEQCWVHMAQKMMVENWHTK